jgi:transcription-repair coupling factor (superfamily II helicase)
MLKGERTAEIVDVKLNLDFIDLSPASGDPDSAAAIPYDYIEEDTQRMNVMKRLAEAEDGRAIRKLSAETTDRFGRMPPAATRLFKVSDLRTSAASKNIGHIDVKGDRAVFYRPGGRDIAYVCTLRKKNADGKLAELAAAVNRISEE